MVKGTYKLLEKCHIVVIMLSQGCFKNEPMVLVLIMWWGYTIYHNCDSMKVYWQCVVLTANIPSLSRNTSYCVGAWWQWSNIVMGIYVCLPSSGSCGHGVLSGSLLLAHIARYRWLMTVCS